MKKMISFALGALMLSVMVAGSGCSNDITSSSVPAKLDGDGTVVFFVYDNSGSMADGVNNSKGQLEAKCDIADRALISVGKRFDAYLAANNSRTLGVGMILIRSGSAHFDSFKVLKSDVSGYLTEWAKHRGSPFGGTPIGSAMNLASDNMVNIVAKNKHIIILTDGENNAGAAPQEVLPSLKKRFKDKGIDLGVHLVAFDVNDATFKEIKAQGATVLGASNEVELKDRLDTILREKILLEKED